MTSITIPAKGVTFSGLPFAPKNVDPGFSGEYAEYVMWSEDDTVTIEVTDDAVFITTETVENIKFGSIINRRTTAYRCPVVVRTCTPDFSVFDGTDSYESLATADGREFGMFSIAGNEAVAAAVDAAINADNLTTATEVAATVKGHPEVNDTVVRDYIHAALLTAGLIRKDA